MKISTGMAEIGINRIQKNTVEKNKIYTWPHYADGKIDKIQRVTRRTDTNIYYTRATDEEREKVLNYMREASYNEYSDRAQASRKGRLIQPGTLFDALV